MRLAQTDTVAGMPAAVAREIVRLFDRVRPAQIADRVVAKAQRDAALDALASAGYLELVRETARDRWWTTTTAGSALAQVSFGRPITRKTADRLVREIVGRARAINADPTLLLSVNRLRVFGSYLREEVDPLGDVDVELVIARRLPANEYVTAARAYADASGRVFGNYTAYLGWPETELRMNLKNRSVALNITLEDVDELTDQVRTVYSIEDDREALPVSGDVLYRR
jgi:predicted nucleotidyltransferase